MDDIRIARIEKTQQDILEAIRTKSIRDQRWRSDAMGSLKALQGKQTELEKRVHKFEVSRWLAGAIRSGAPAWATVGVLVGIFAAVATIAWSH